MSWVPKWSKETKAPLEGIMHRELWVLLLKVRTPSAALPGRRFSWAGAWMDPQHLRAAAAPKMRLDKDSTFIFFLSFLYYEGLQRLQKWHLCS